MTGLRNNKVRDESQFNPNSSDQQPVHQEVDDLEVH